VNFIIPVDLFGDRIDFTCTNFQDLERITDSMIICLAKYSFLDPSRAKSEIEKFKVNFELIQCLLGEVEAFFLSNKSELQKIQSQVDEINKNLTTLFARPDVNIRFGTWDTATTAHLLSHSNKRATQTKNVRTTFSCDGFSTGKHTWSLSILSRPSTCFVGVAPKSIPPGKSIYRSHGYFCDLNGGAAYCNSKINNLPNVTAPSTVGVILDCTLKTLSFSINKGAPIATHNNVDVSQQLHLAWNNDGTSGSIIDILSQH